MKTEQIIEEREDSVKMKMRFKRFLSGFMAVATLICFFGVKEISMFVNHEHICIKEFLVEKLEKDFEYELKVLCNQNYINCTYAIARIQNIKPLVWDDNFQYYIVPE